MDKMKLLLPATCNCTLRWKELIMSNFNISPTDQQQAWCQRTSWGQGSSGALPIKSLPRPQRWSRTWWSVSRSTEQRKRPSHHRRRCLMCRASRSVCLCVWFEHQNVVSRLVCETLALHQVRSWVILQIQYSYYWRINYLLHCCANCFFAFVVLHFNRHIM